MTISDQLRARIEAWTRSPFDAETIDETRHLLAEAERTGDWTALRERFELELAFGTGGLRGVMGVGANRMNRANVARATQGVADYLRAHRGPDAKLSAVVGYDSRHRSREFAMETARIFAANGFKAYVFNDLRPTPMLSFATMELGADAGVMITASHNPPEYNGYKLYRGDGQQVVGQEADDIIARVRQTQFGQIRETSFESLAASGKIEWLGADFDDRYLKALESARLAPEVCEKHGADLKIVFTGLHGTGGKVTPRALKEWGFQNVSVVAAQHEPDGSFPTVKSPNPEERAALDLALSQADREGADLVLGTDPDADRVGAAIRDDQGKLVLINGNETAVLLTYYAIARRRELDTLPRNGAVIKTIVTTDLISAIAKSNKIQCFETLTGFKYIGELMNAWDDHGRNRENPSVTYLFGGEESYGCLVGTHTRDKDAVVACCALAEAAAWAREQKTTLWGLLARIHARHGVYREGLVTKTLPGLQGMVQIEAVVERLRRQPPATMLGEPLREIRDYGEGIIRGAQGQEIGRIDLPYRENVVQLFYGDALKITGRPSGTEPKVKFYLAASHRKGLPLTEGEVPALRAKLDANIQAAKGEIDSLIASVVGKP
jgi:phosphoglucomutase